MAKAPLLDLRLFGNRIFLNASLLGYVSTVALFGAEFLMPVYLQALRGRTALRDRPDPAADGASPAASSVTLSGPAVRPGRPAPAGGGRVRHPDDQHLAALARSRPTRRSSWILFLLALRGLALGLTVQTTLVTALSVVPRSDLARGSSLTNATRQVVQSIGVAVLATVLASTISPEVQALQQQFVAGQRPRRRRASRPGLCEPVSVAWTWAEDAGSGSAFSGIAHATALQNPVAPPPNIDLVQRACQENIAGFERTYKITFYGALLALLLGLLLPGWPGRWAGRQMAGDPPPMGH